MYFIALFRVSYENGKKGENEFLLEAVDVNRAWDSAARCLGEKKDKMTLEHLYQVMKIELEMLVGQVQKYSKLFPEQFSY